MRHLSHTPFKVALGVACTAILLSAYATYAWTGPSTAPPGNNVAPPINTSASGQVKTGDFATQGKMGVGTPSPSAAYMLDVYKAGWKGYFHGTDGGISIGPANVTWAHIYSDNAAQPIIFNTDVFTTTNGFSSYNGDLQLKTSSGGPVGTTHLSISNANGAVTINTGSSGGTWAMLNIPGTPGTIPSINTGGAIYSYDKICVSNAAGTCTGAGGTTMLSTGIKFPDGTTQTTAAVGGGVSGSGSTNYMPRWTGATSLGNSSITSDGSSATSQGNFFAPIMYDSNDGAYFADPNGYSRFGRSMTGTINTWGQTDWGSPVDIRGNTNGIPFSSIGNGTAQLLIDSDQGPVAIAFHRPGIYGAAFGLDTDNQFSTQGWSAGGGYTGFKTGQTTVNGYLHVSGYGADNWFPYVNGWNYLRGPTNLSGLLYDEQDNGYYLDLNGTSRINYAVFDNAYSYGWFQSPIFYDANNNGYYIDPDNTSRTNAIVGNAYYYASDSRLKDNIKHLDSALWKLLQIDGVTFNWNDKAGAERVGKHDVGVIAQDVEKVYPEAVTTTKDGYKAVDYPRLVPLLINAIKEQQTEIDSLKARLDALEAKSK